MGTEFGCYVTLNGGRNWHTLMNGMPTVAVHDLVVHPRDNDLIAATHGRSLFVLDDITPLQQLKGTPPSGDAHLFAQRTATWWIDNSRGGQTGSNTYAGENPPSVRASMPLPDRARIANTPIVTYYLGESAQGEAELQIRSLAGDQSRTVRSPATPGIHRFAWDGRFDPPAGTAGQEGRRGQRFGAAASTAAGPGTYLLVLRVNGRSYSGVLNVRPDPLLSNP